MLRAHAREAGVGTAIAALALAMAVVRPAYFTQGNLTDMFLSALPVLVAAAGMTLVILVGEIDISIGSTFAVCGVVCGALVNAGVPLLVVVPAVIALGVLLHAASGALVAYAGLPSIIVTLAMMVAVRDGLRWTTEGAWIQDLPEEFQWFGLGRQRFPAAAGLITAAVFAGLGWALRWTVAGRMLYMTGSNAEVARLGGIDTARVKGAAFAVLGALTAVAAVLNAVRFSQIPPNAGVGFELEVIAAVVVGGASITGGRGTLLGTLLGVVLLAAIGPALTFLGVSAYWERAIQGGIILAAVGLSALPAARSTAGKLRAARA